MEPRHALDRALDEAAQTSSEEAGDGDGGGLDFRRGRRPWRRARRNNVERAKHAAAKALQTMSSRSAVMLPESFGLYT